MRERGADGRLTGAPLYPAIGAAAADLGSRYSMEESAAPALPEGPNAVSLEDPTSLAETARSKLSAFTNREKARLHTEEEHKENSMNTAQVGASHPASLVQAVDSDIQVLPPLIEMRTVAARDNSSDRKVEDHRSPAAIRTTAALMRLQLKQEKTLKGVCSCFNASSSFYNKECAQYSIQRLSDATRHACNCRFYNKQRQLLASLGQQPITRRLSNDPT
ncbi:hypothetical protein FOZ63_009955 [Perkinsus olseni]|uniref:Uncharacterized protein n=1 Tax=Perkinsus olseni TaxID=32597 RepID=A0A7J6PVD7_PEROL|nr:hypothetical protein FOZ63_009955 [Perkinsus olseni]